METFRKLARRFGGGEAEEDPLPIYMHPIEFSQMLAIIEALAPRRVLEWGSGGSTRALLKRCDFIERFVSIEHNRAWYERVETLVDDPRLELLLREPVVPEPPERGEAMTAWANRCEEDPTILADYVAAGAEQADPFDFILVDGRARVFCLRAGWEKLRSGGVILIHDAQRPEYHATVESLGRAVFLEPFEQGQICFVRKP